jgi:hypothetical protein
LTPRFLRIALLVADGATGSCNPHSQTHSGGPAEKDALAASAAPASHTPKRRKSSRRRLSVAPPRGRGRSLRPRGCNSRRITIVPPGHTNEAPRANQAGRSSWYRKRGRARCYCPESPSPQADEYASGGKGRRTRRRGGYARRTTKPAASKDKDGGPNAAETASVVSARSYQGPPRTYLHRDPSVGSLSYVQSGAWRLVWPDYDRARGKCRQYPLRTCAGGLCDRTAL